MLFEANTITGTNLGLSHTEQQQQQRSAQNSQQKVSSLINNLQPTMSSLSPIPNAANSENNKTVLESNVNQNPQLITTNQESQLVECVMPDIYLTKDFITWKEEQLRTHGFTHIIIIDKHIQELYYPNQQPDIFKLCSMSNKRTENLTYDVRHDNNSLLNEYDYYNYPTPASAKHLSFGKEFDVIDLNFGEKSYLTTVLPNCYKAVKFINKALLSGGRILVIDCNGGEQKCLTIIVAYLMYKNNISFSDAFACLKEFYNRADLDRFYISQLYEYEPILQVQRAQSRGHSCSRKLNAAILKRKKNPDDDENSGGITGMTRSANTSLSSSTTSTTRELLNNCNPLNRFDCTQMDSQETKSLMTPPTNQHNTHTFTGFLNGITTATATTTPGGWYNWDDCTME